MRYFTIAVPNASLDADDAVLDTVLGKVIDRGLCVGGGLDAGMIVLNVDGSYASAPAAFEVFMDLSYCLPAKYDLVFKAEDDEEDDSK